MVRLHDNSSGREGRQTIASRHKAQRPLLIRIRCKIEHRVVFTEWYLVEGACLLVVVELLVSCVITLEVTVHPDQVKDSESLLSTHSNEIKHELLHVLLLMLSLNPIMPLLRGIIFFIHSLVLFLLPKGHKSAEELHEVDLVVHWGMI